MILLVEKNDLMARGLLGETDFHMSELEIGSVFDEFTLKNFSLLAVIYLHTMIMSCLQSEIQTDDLPSTLLVVDFVS